ncbi:MAG: DUF2442 domain-containing protein [Desulfitobacteriaceae bacterium]
MNPRVIDVKPGGNYTIILKFDNDEIRVFDVSPYLDYPFFLELKDEELFNTVRSTLGTVVWKNGQDFCPDTLYEESSYLQHQ